MLNEMSLINVTKDKLAKLTDTGNQHSINRMGYKVEKYEHTRHLASMTYIAFWRCFPLQPCQTPTSI
jgi:hypothetical protein